MTTLDELKKGDTAKIKSFAKGERAYRQKLLAMGLTPGSEFQVVRLAPLGDPIQINVRGFNLSLRKNEASSITVEKQPQ